MTFRQIKFWVSIPYYIIDKFILSKIFNYIPLINLRYKENAAIIDLGKSLSMNIINNNLTKINLSDIENKKLRWSLFLSGIFKKWNIYYVRNRGDLRNSLDNKRHVIYISRDKIKKGDKYYGERISDYMLNKNYSSRKIRRFLKKRGLSYSEFYKIELQQYSIVSVHTKRHDKMKVERDIRYKKKYKKAIEKTVKYAIKRDYLFTCKSFIGDYSNLPLFYKVVKADRIDLAKKMLDSALDDEERKKLVNYKIDNYGDFTLYSGKSPMDYVKSKEMEDFLKPWLN